MKIIFKYNDVRLMCFFRLLREIMLCKIKTLQYMLIIIMIITTEKKIIIMIITATTTTTTTTITNKEKRGIKEVKGRSRLVNSGGRVKYGSGVYGFG